MKLSALSERMWFYLSYFHRARRRLGLTFDPVLLGLVLAAWISGLGGVAAPIEAVSVVDPGLVPAAAGSGDSGSALVNANGRFVAFSSSAANLVANGQTPDLQAYLRDRQAGTTLLVSASLDGRTGGDDASTATGLSADGRFVVFESRAKNLVTNRVSGAGDIYVRDVLNDITTLVSVSPTGQGGAGNSTGASITPDGRFVLFESLAEDLVPNDANQESDIFVRDLAKQTTTLVSVDWLGAQSAVGHVSGFTLSSEPAITPDGRFVVFQSLATNLVAESVQSPTSTLVPQQIYIRDLGLATNILVSANLAGQAANRDSQDPVASSDGRYVVFGSISTNLTEEGNATYQLLLFRKDTQTSKIDLIGPIMGQERAGISADAGLIAYVATNQVFLWQQSSGLSSLITTNATGLPGNGGSSSPLLSDDGRTFVFTSTSTDLTDTPTAGVFEVFVHDGVSGVNRLLSATADPPAGSLSDCINPSLSSDGTVVAFEAFDTGLLPGDNNHASDVFARGTVSGPVELISSLSPDLQPVTATLNSTLADSGISDDGRYVLYWGPSDDLTPNDQNGSYDVFERDTLLQTNILVSVNSAGTGPANQGSDSPVMSPYGRYVAFWSTASDLVAGYTNTQGDLFVRDVVAHKTTVATVLPSLNPSLNQLLVPTSPIVWSSDGRYLAFVAIGLTGLEQIALRDLLSETTVLVPANSPSLRPISAVAITDDGALWYLISIGSQGPPTTNFFRYDIQGGVIQAIGTNIVHAAVTPDGRYAVGQDVGYTRNQIWRFDIMHPELGGVLLANLPMEPYLLNTSRWRLAISGDARYVAFLGQSTSNTKGSDVFVVDAQNPGNVSLVSVNVDGSGGGNDSSDRQSISADGRYVTFRSAATNLVAGDTNGQPDIFVRDLKTGTTTLVSASLGGGAGNSRSFHAWINRQGTAIAFESAASDLVTGDYNGFIDVFLYHLPPSILAGITPPQTGTPPTIVWSVEAGKSYHVEFKDSLGDATWSVLPGTPAAKGTGEMGLQDTSLSPNHQRFYRVVQEP